MKFHAKMTFLEVVIMFAVRDEWNLETSFHPSLKITVCCLTLDSRESRIYGFRWMMRKQVECLNILSRISGINFTDCPHDVDSLE